MNNLTEDKIVWLDLTGRSCAEDIRKRLQMDVFENIDWCIDYITDMHDTNTVLIISGEITEEILLLIDQCHQLKAIYLLNQTAEKNSDWTDRYNRIRGSFTHIDQVLVKLSYENRLSAQQVPFNTFINIENAIDVASASKLLNIKFMYFHILIDIFLKMSLDDDSLSKQDMITHLTRIFYDDEKNRQRIDEFNRTYERSNAIHWYTKDKFLYELLNKALRESDFDILFALRMFIVDLYNQIVAEYEQFRARSATDSCSSSLTVYRGQSITHAELNILRQRQGGYFSMQNFISTSTNPEVAYIYSGAGVPNTNTDQTWIMYEFKLATHLNSTKSYASISHLSQFVDEDEILIALGAVFHIETVEFDENNQRWHAVLSLCDDENFDLHEIMRQYAAEIVADKVSPGFLLYQQGNYTKANEYFRTVQNMKPLQMTEKAHIYRGLGAVAAEEKYFPKACAYFRKELNIWKRLNKEKDKMESFRNIGDMLFYMGRYKEALDHLQIALKYFRSNNYEMEYARIYGQIGHIMIVNEQWEEGMMCFELQLEVREKTLHANHEDIGITHTHIGNAYVMKKDYTKAIEHFTKALEIYAYSYQPDHPNYLQAQENLRNAQRSIDTNVGLNAN
ncbi:unnamed protein product [Adineta ricciae]|uniref:NAD(P)(+)--arginine ADP-ribosyltransferase n=1 Tax=Adineta ricciae TaxID=249248 RepID=A0A815PQK7_ADIRI|nr:unnamed protein product [Adineta ricciae]CAF1452715.1 unnamed protein product [Adineta ricciae]